jgi:hypothetical protein
MATFRRKPLYLVRFTGLPRNMDRNSSALKEANFSSGGANSRGANAVSEVSGALRFHGQTSWQISQPNTCLPMDIRYRSGAGPRNSIVK